MMYLLAILLPPLAVIIYGRWLAFIFTAGLFLMTPIAGPVTWIIAAIIALVAVNNEKNRRFMKGQIDRVIGRDVARHARISDKEIHRQNPI